MRGRNRWEWYFWSHDDEEEIIIYSPGSYTSTIDDDYFVVVLFRTEARDWWLCKFEPLEDGETGYIRVENYKDQLREALITCRGLNKMMGAY